MIEWQPVRVKLGDLKPWGHNPRQSTKKQAQRILASFGEFGQVQAVAIGPECEVYDGHQRLSALLTLHGKSYEIDARRASRALTDDERKRLVLMLHAGATGEWDWDALSSWDGALLQDGGLDKDLLAQMNRDSAALMALLEAGESGEAVEDVEPQADKAEELREKWGTATGQLWQLGDHRLLCGDSTKAEDVARVMGGEKADICFTSPPYAAQREYKTGAFDWDKLMQGVFANLQMADAGQVLVNLGMAHENGEWMPYWNDWIEWMRAQGWKRFGWYVWDQLFGLRGNWAGRCAPSHEFVFHFNKQSVDAVKWIESKRAGERGGELRTKKGGKDLVPANTGDLVQSHKVPDSVWRVNRQMGGIDGHPAPFSVEFASIALKTWPSRIAYEPFNGSGTTIMACEQLQRQCRAIELDAGYIAVALERWSTATGKTPTLIEP